MCAQRRMQPVGGDEVPRPHVAGTDQSRRLLDRGDDARADPRAGGPGRIPHRLVQHRASHATAGPVPEPGPGHPLVAVDDATVTRGAARSLGVSPAAGLPVGDAGHRAPGRVDAEGLQVAQRAGHQPFAAGLVDHPGAPLVDQHLQARPGRADRDGQPGRTAAGHHQVNRPRAVLRARRAGRLG